MTTFGRNLMREILRTKTSQLLLARKAGVGVRTIQRILDKDSNPTLTTVGKICKALGVRVSRMMDE